MRIGIAIRRLRVRGGKERDCLALAAALKQRGHDVTIATTETRLPLPNGVKLVLGRAGYATNHAAAAGFADWVADLRDRQAFDVVLTFDKAAGDVYYAADVCLADRLRGIRRLLPRYRTLAALEARLFRPDGPHILYLCHLQKEIYGLHYPHGVTRAGVLPPVVHDDRRPPERFYAERDAVRDALSIDRDAPLAIHVAAYGHEKGIDRALAALAALPGLHLLSVGLREPRAARRQADRLGVAARARFMPYSDDVPTLLSAADLMVHPARVENTGLVIIESLVAGVPVVTTANCGYAEHVIDHRAGTVLPLPFDEDRLVAAIAALIEPGALREARRNARAAAAGLAGDGLAPVVDAVEDALRQAGARYAPPSHRPARDEPADLPRQAGIAP